MRIEAFEALVLRSVDYKENARILTLFTPLFGLISVIVKTLSYKSEKFILTSPFTIGEFHCVQKEGNDLWRFVDGTVIQDSQHLKGELSYLLAAAQMADALTRSQGTETPAPLLYQLIIKYLQQIPHFPDPEILTTSFYLKLLRHEGLIALQPQCARCTEPTACLHEGESLCSAHAEAPSLPLSPDERDHLYVLSMAKEYHPLKQLTLPEGLKKKIHNYFVERIENR